MAHAGSETLRYFSDKFLQEKEGSRLSTTPLPAQQCSPGTRLRAQHPDVHQDSGDVLELQDPFRPPLERKQPC